jgi:hypothetical protein
VNVDLNTEGRLLFLLPHNSENCSNQGTKINKKDLQVQTASIIKEKKRKEKLPPFPSFKPSKKKNPQNHV